MDKKEERVATEESKELQKNNLSEQIKEAVTGLYYISETDAEILPFIGEKSVATSKESILSQTKSPSNSPVEERDFAEFFKRLSEIQDWYGDEEKETARRFLRLKELLERSLKELKVYKIGKIQLDIYVVGLDAENNLLGVRTKAVET